MLCANKKMRIIISIIVVILILIGVSIYYFYYYQKPLGDPNTEKLKMQLEVSKTTLREQQ